MKTITSLSELRDILDQHRKVYLLLWKQGSEQSECAFKAYSEASAKHPEMMAMAADVSVVNDIHPAFGINSAPSLLQFEDKELKNVWKGCHQENFFGAMFEEAVYQAKIRESGKPSKSVTVYSTPTCSWCNTLKQWLRKNHIPYSEIDVSRDERAAQELVRRSGQQGVPQTEINGQIVVGFDQTKLRQLLEIQ
jgi:glutaredoxin-like YruB-family protein